MFVEYRNILEELIMNMQRYMLYTIWIVSLCIYIYTHNMKSVRYEKINMDNYFYSILVEENFRRINNEHAVLHIYT